MSSIRISQLSDFTQITGSDFMPLVDSSSLTTYKVTVTSFSGWFSVSGSALSSSWASSSRVSVSSSWASSSISASTAATLIWPNTATSSFSQNSVSASWADRAGNSLTSSNTVGSASWSAFAKSSSFANTASNALTASYYNFSLPSSTPPTASYSNFSTSASYSDFSKSSSYSDFSKSSSFSVTASYVNSSAGGASPIAWATILIPTASGYSSTTPATVTLGNQRNKPIILNGYNVSDVQWCSRTILPNSSWLHGYFLSHAPEAQTDALNLLVTLTNPSSNLNYCVIGTGAETQNRQENLDIAFYPYQARTSTQFTMSMFGDMDYSGLWESIYFSFVVYA